MTNVTAVIGAGLIGQAIARRVGTGRHVLLAGPRGPGYRRMLELSPARRIGTPDEVGTVGALLMGPDGGFITGSDCLMEGGTTASYLYGELAPGLARSPSAVPTRCSRWRRYKSEYSIERESGRSGDRAG